MTGQSTVYHFLLLSTTRHDSLLFITFLFYQLDDRTVNYLSISPTIDHITRQSTIYPFPLLPTKCYGSLYHRILPGFLDALLYFTIVSNKAIKTLMSSSTVLHSCLSLENPPRIQDVAVFSTFPVLAAGCSAWSGTFLNSLAFLLALFIMFRLAFTVWGPIQMVLSLVLTER